MEEVSLLLGLSLYDGGGFRYTPLSFCISMGAKCYALLQPSQSVFSCNPPLRAGATPMLAKPKKASCGVERLIQKDA